MTYLLAIGGYSDDVTGRIDRYDPAEDRWTRVGDLVHPRMNVEAAVHEGRIYTCGGLDDEGDAIPDVEQSDLTAMEWVDDSWLKAPRYGHAAVSLGDKIYVLGGASGDRESSIDVLEPGGIVGEPCYDGRWVRAGELPVALGPAIATVLDGRVWIVGELELTQWEVWSGELPAGPWTREAAFSLDRRWPAVCAFEGAFYFCGGVAGEEESEQTPSPRVDRFDLASRSVQALPSMPTARHSASAVGADGRVYVMGGCNAAEAMPAVEAFDLAEQTWRDLAPLEEGRYGICALAI